MTKNTKVTCTKRCYDVAERQARASKRKSEGEFIAWNKDGKDGPDDSYHSEAIIIKWMMNPFNLDCFKGDNKKGQTKLGVCSEISELCKDASCGKYRDHESIKNKINNIIQSYKNATDIMSGDTLKSEILKICPYYYELHQVLKDRASITAPATTDDLDQSEEESDEEESDNVDEKKVEKKGTTYASKNK